MTNTTLLFAQQLATKGFRLFPVIRWHKEPAIKAWQDRASSDPREIADWFDNNQGYNLGLACGPQPNGLNILAIDVDPKHGGSWQALVDEFGDPGLTVIHHTPSGGEHRLFDAPPDLRNSRSKLGQGIDTRGAGGFIVLPPSKIVDEHGELLPPYSALRGEGLWKRTPAPLTAPYVAALSTPLPTQPHTVNGYTHDGGSLADRLRSTWNWHDELSADGWRFVKQVGDDGFYARPGKTDRGHSAVVHPSGAFTVFSTEAPTALERIGVPTRDGTGYTVSPFQYLSAMRFGGDQTAAARSLAGTHDGTPRPDPRNEPEQGALQPVSDSSLNLPREFWDQRLVLQQIFQAARATMVSPDALLVHILCRWSAMVPPCYKLPAVIGAQATLDLLGAVVAETSGGKSIAGSVARELVVNPNEQVMMDYPIGSGEGLVQSFFVPEKDGEGKLTGRQIVGKQGIHFSIDEGMALINQAARQGTTIIPTLTSAWSGMALGQANADPSRRRIIEGGRVRVAGVLNMQASNGWRLFEEQMAAMGFPGRIVFATAHDPTATGEPIEMPGPIRFPMLPIIGTGVVLTYDPTISSEVSGRRLGVLTGEVAIDHQRSHELLARCKVASLLALQEDRRHVSESDWTIAGQIMESSGYVLDHLAAVKRHGDVTRRHSAAMAQGEKEIIVEDVKERRGIARMTATIEDKVRTNSIAVGKLRKAVSAASTRHRFEAALDLAIQKGAVKVVDGRVQKA